MLFSLAHACQGITSDPTVTGRAVIRLTSFSTADIVTTHALTFKESHQPMFL